jgi:hypothetical protein
MNICVRVIPCILTFVALSGCASSPAPFALPAAPKSTFAPATRNGMVVPSYGSGYNPETGTRAEGH